MRGRVLLEGNESVHRAFSVKILQVETFVCSLKSLSVGRFIQSYIICNVNTVTM